MTSLTAVYHYFKDDTDCDEDYAKIELLHGKQVIATWGDSYHDKGAEKLKGFIEGVEWALGKQVTLIREDVADWDG
jgi:hypothetical protein